MRPNDSHPTAQRRAGWNRLIEGTRGTKMIQFTTRETFRDARGAALAKGRVRLPVVDNGEKGGQRIANVGAMADNPMTIVRNGNSIVEVRTIQIRTRTSRVNVWVMDTRRSGVVSNY